MVKTAMIDSSIQGFMHVHALLRSHPLLEYVFFCDDAITSIYEKTELFRRIKKDVRFLVSRGAQRIILIDNKVCSLILDELKKEFPEIEFVDFLSLFVQKIFSSKYEKILICADEQTIAQCRFRNELKALDPEMVIGQKACSPLENLIKQVNDPFFIQNYLESSLSLLKERSDLVVLANSAYAGYKRMFEYILNCPAYLGEDLLEASMFETSMSLPQQYCFTTDDPNQMSLQIKNRFSQKVIVELAPID